MQKYSIHSLLAKIFAQREYNEQDVQGHTSKRLIYHDFSLFLDADLVLDRIQEALENDEKICIYGDYDCDGILSTTILVQAFLELGKKVGYHIPNRFEDGYGLNKERVQQMYEKGYSLLITVDNGIKAYEAIDLANELGIDVIVIDHHDYDELPDACAIIHTKMSSDYPFKEICGGFLAYKLASSLLGKHDKYLFSLAAITTISDMMPLVDENKSLVSRGLQFMNEEKYFQLELLIGENQKYNTTTLKRMRQFYLLIEKGARFGHQLSWSHYVELLPLKDNNEINYYIKMCEQRNLDVRSLRSLIKSKEYERLDEKTKNKLITNEELKLPDLIPDPILIKTEINKEILTEYALKQAILGNLDNFLKQLGDGFSYIGSEYKIKIGNNYNYIGLLLYNVKFKCYVVVELKVTELKKEHIGQVEVYMNYIDKNVKALSDDKTIGIIICARNNKYIIEYSSDERIFAREFKLII